MTKTTTPKKDPFVGYVPHGPEWKAFMLKQPKTLIVDVASGIAEERDRYKAALRKIFQLSPLGSDIERHCVNALKITR